MIGLAPQGQGARLPGAEHRLRRVDTYNKIISQDTANVISTSWGMCETGESATILSENTLFQEAATQGQSVFAASGDFGLGGLRRLGHLARRRRPRQPAVRDRRRRHDDADARTAAEAVGMERRVRRHRWRGLVDLVDAVLPVGSARVASRDQLALLSALPAAPRPEATAARCPTSRQTPIPDTGYLIYYKAVGAESAGRAPPRRCGPRSRRW